jgi:hypothetical protein
MHFTRVTDHYLDLWTQIIQDGMTTGEFKPGHPRLAAFTILGSCNRAYKWYQDGGKHGRIIYRKR